MKSIKKHLSILMTAVMILSLVPLSSFAVDPALVGPVTTYTQADKNKEVKLTLNLGKLQDLKTGTALFQLSNAKLASVAGSAVATVVQGTTSKSSPDLTFVTTSGAALTGGESFFNLKVNTATPANNLDEILVVVTLKLNFSDSEGDVRLSIKDYGTGIGDSEIIVASDAVSATKDMNVKVGNKDKKIGPAGGELSAITITELGKLSATTNKNSLVISLPKGYKFTPATKVETSAGSPNVTYSAEKDQLIIKNINDQTTYVNVIPFIILEATNTAKDGPITAGFELKIDDNNITSMDKEIAKLVDYGMTVTATEKGKKSIPTLTKGQSKTIEVTLDAVDGTLGNGQVLEFEVQGADLVYGKTKLVDPTSSILTAPNKDSEKVSGYDVYQNQKFAIRTHKYNVTKIKLELEIIAKPGAKTVTITAATPKLDNQTIEIAKALPALATSVTPKAYEKGKEVTLPSITLTESEANILQKGDKVYLTLVYPNSETDKGERVSFTDVSAIKVDTKNSLAVTPIQLGAQPNILVLEVNSRSYTNPGVITLSNIKGFTTEKAFSGDVKLQVAVNKSVEEETNYFSVTEGSTQGETKFTIGSQSYMANGVAKTLVTAPYIKGTGYTMLPVRALGESLGLSANWDNMTKIATFASEGKVAIVKIGENFITVNGMKQTLNAPAEIKNGSTMIELRSLAKAFDVNLDWNAATKTVKVN